MDTSILKDTKGSGYCCKIETLRKSLLKNAIKTGVGASKNSMRKPLLKMVG